MIGNMQFLAHLVL